MTPRELKIILGRITVLPNTQDAALTDASL